MDRDKLIQGAKYVGIAALVAATVHCCDSGFKHECDIFGNKIGIYSTPTKDGTHKKTTTRRVKKKGTDKKQGPVRKPEQVKTGQTTTCPPATVTLEYKKAGEDDGLWNIYAVDFRQNKDTTPSLTKYNKIPAQDISKDVHALMKELTGKDFKNASYNIKGTLALVDTNIGAKKNFDHIHSEWSNNYAGELITFNGKINDRYTVSLRPDNLAQIVENLEKSLKNTGNKIKRNVTVVIDSDGQANALVGTDPNMCIGLIDHWGVDELVYRVCPQKVSYEGGGAGGVVIMNNTDYHHTTVNRQPPAQPQSTYNRRNLPSGNRP